jgi:hypothetical protein
VGQGAQNVPLTIQKLVLHPPTPYTLSPLLKGGEVGVRGIVHPCAVPFGALLVTLYQIFSKGSWPEWEEEHWGRRPAPVGGWPPPKTLYQKWHNSDKGRYSPVWKGVRIFEAWSQRKQDIV